jgi:hypothetical protein
VREIVQTFTYILAALSPGMQAAMKINFAPIGAREMNSGGPRTSVLSAFRHSADSH